MFKYIAITLVVVVAGVLLYAVNKPDTFRVERTATIKAAPGKIFPLVSDLHKWGEWSPWEKIDPALKRTYSGPESGPGSTYAWEGNKKVGKGRMQITEVSPPSRIVIKLDFEKPMEGHNISDFTLEAKGDSTLVTWDMHGPSPFIAKVMSVFLSMDKVIGKDFEAGLANLKAAAEK